MTAYITVTELAEYLGIESAADDALLATLIDGACESIDTYTGNTFAAASDSTRYFDHRSIAGATLYLGGYLCAITSITNGDGATVASTQYVTEPRNKTPWYALVLKRDATTVWNGIGGEIAITGKWAYMATPNDAIKHIVKRLATWRYRQRDNASESDRAMIAGMTTIMPSRVPADIAQDLAAYKEKR